MKNLPRRKEERQTNPSNSMMENNALMTQEHYGDSSGPAQFRSPTAMLDPDAPRELSPLDQRAAMSSTSFGFGMNHQQIHNRTDRYSYQHDMHSPMSLHDIRSSQGAGSTPLNGRLTEHGERENSIDNSFSNMFNYQGDALSPEHPRIFQVTPVVEGGKVFYYCHLCSFCGSDEDSLSQHLESHFEHRCGKCDYTSRTEGRLKQHIQRFHNPRPNTNEEEGGQDIKNILSLGEAGQPLETATSRPARTPIRRKVHRCKQCEYTCINKNDFWAHAKTHIKEDKVLQCPKCPFVTEYKHHLEYHLRNHFGSKPYKCQKCNYTCVNKSMLNSHMKSHTSIYQYRCATCTYATKYCHSLKLHLKKYDHTPASILNLDGTVEHDTSSLLTMKRSGPKSAKVKVEKKTNREKMNTQSPLISQPSTSHQSFPPPPPPGMIPFWPSTAFGGDMGNAPTPFPMAMNRLFRGLMPASMKQMKHGGDAAGNSPYQNTHKCEECGLIVNSHEQLAQHKATRHGNQPGMLGLFGNMGVDRFANNMLWPRPDLLGMSAAVKAAMSLSPFGHNNPMQLAMGGLIRPPQQPFSFMKEHQQGIFNGKASATPATQARSASSASSVGSTQPVETPLDLTKPSQSELQQSDQRPGNRVRSRKGKALKLDELCLRLQEKMNSENGEMLGTPAEASNGSSPVSASQASNRYPSPTESGEGISSDNSHAEPKIDSESNNNNIKFDSPKKIGENMPVHMPQLPGNNNNHEISEVDSIIDMEDTHSPEKFTCTHCEITFGDCSMYTMHMGYHGYQNPFVCNMCGEESVDKVSFFCHIARAGHP